MKKIKLIAPILGLSAVALPAATLTSCDKDQGKVSEIEWNNAFEYLANKNYKSAWKASDGDGVRSWYQQTASGVTSTQYIIYRDINIKQDILNLDVIEYDDYPESNAEPLTYKDMQGLIRNNYSFEFTYKVDTSMEKTDCSINTTSSFQSLITSIFEQYIDYKNFTYENGSYLGHYSVQHEIIAGGVISGELSSKITFNNDKRIGFIDTFILLASESSQNDSETYQIFEMTLHPQYSNIDASIHEDYLNWTSDHIKNMEQDKTSTSKTIKDNKGFVTNITNHQYNKITVKNGNNTLKNVKSIYKNGKLLDSDTEYSYEADNSLKFNTPITTQDRVSLLVKTDTGVSVSDELTVSIIQE